MISNDLLILYDTKKDIKEALRQCNVSMNGETFREYVDKIDEVIPQMQQWGATLVDWFGVTDENGNFSAPTSTWDFDASEEFASEACIRKVPAEMLRGFLLNKKIRSINLKDLTEVGHYGMYDFAKSCTTLETVDLSSLETVGDYGLAYAFNGASSMKSCDVSKIKNVGNYGLSNAFSKAGDGTLNLSFDGLETITSTHPLHSMVAYGKIDTLIFPNLISISTIEEMARYSTINKISFPKLETCGDMRNAFRQATIKEIELPKLKTITGAVNAFSGTKVEKINLDGLEHLTNGHLNGAFENCRELTKMSFPSLTSVGIYAFSNTQGTAFAFNGCTKLTEFHFRADMKAQIEALAGYGSKFGATNATIYFDL